MSGRRLPLGPPVIPSDAEELALKGESIGELATVDTKGAALSITHGVAMLGVEDAALPNEPECSSLPKGPRLQVLHDDESSDGRSQHPRSWDTWMSWKSREPSGMPRSKAKLYMASSSAFSPPGSPVAMSNLMGSHPSTRGFVGDNLEASGLRDMVFAAVAPMGGSSSFRRDSRRLNMSGSDVPGCSAKCLRKDASTSCISANRPSSFSTRGLAASRKQRNLAPPRTGGSRTSLISH
mmetsp:Transcript_76643/g.213016  ORF Transcript_76643/g.213016 Transcript_76643/m.213016 type:complete len:237 (-) Transcript_76643:1773-2483(-)